MATIGVVGEMDSVSMSGPLLTTGIPEATRVLPTVFSSTGKVQRVETLENNHIHVEILPDDIAMKTDFIIADWNRVTVLFYWVGLQTPAPVETNIKMDTVKASLGRQVTIGYLFTESPTVVFFSSHKKPGDPQ
ncbi:MAG: hypothetical protein HZB51_15405 [Chloroflexi bacterium]|nr:hypothetical protein [Chloroflexota bacterium]